MESGKALHHSTHSLSLPKTTCRRSSLACRPHRTWPHTSSAALGAASGPAHVLSGMCHTAELGGRRRQRSWTTGAG
eukprot:358413-Chlamydomonas_euryale.AAC.26